NFIGTIGLMGAAAMLPISSYAAAKKPKYKLGLQLFSVNEDMNRDPIGTLKAVTALGYQDFEIFGFDGDKGTFYGHKASEFKKILNDFQVTASSGHFGFSPYFEKSGDELKRFVDQCIAGARALDLKYITWPWLAPEQRTIDHFKLLSGKLNLIGEQVKAACLGFAYHNHGFEFTDHNGENGFD